MPRAKVAPNVSPIGILILVVVILVVVGVAYYSSSQGGSTTTTPFTIVGMVDHFDGSQSGYLAIYVNVGGGALAPIRAQYAYGILNGNMIVTSGYTSAYCVGLQRVGPSSNTAKICLGDYVIANVTHTATSDVIVSIIDTTTHTQTP